MREVDLLMNITFACADTHLFGMMEAFHVILLLGKTVDCFICIGIAFLKVLPKSKAPGST